MLYISLAPIQLYTAMHTPDMSSSSWGKNRQVYKFIYKHVRDAILLAAAVVIVPLHAND
jgi:hypothetical protein